MTQILPWATDIYSDSKEFPSFYGNVKFVTVFKKTHFGSYPEPIKSVHIFQSLVMKMDLG
jgi:hypothetical protein